jgi:hypothetical protein
LLLLGEDLVVAGKEFFEAVGLGIPFYLAVAAYGFFWWLDGSASEEARAAISAWLGGRGYDNADVSAAILGSFERLYSKRLLSVGGFSRSAVWSIVMWCVFFSS